MKIERPNFGAHSNYIEFSSHLKNQNLKLQKQIYDAEDDTSYFSASKGEKVIAGVSLEAFDVYIENPNLA